MSEPKLRNSGYQDAYDISSRFQAYLLAQAEERAAYQQYNYSSTLLEFNRAKMRAAEIESQSWDSIKGLSSTGPVTERERNVAIAAARYVICGRAE